MQGINMGDDKKQDSTDQVEEGTSKAESSDEKQPGSAGAPAPGDDDIIIK
ncbi:MAG: hypothetical protein ABJA18_01710 [bacterium]